MSAIELKFDPELYSGEAIDFAIKTYQDFADVEQERKPDAFIVRVSSKGDHDPELIADELANFALGTTIEQHRHDM